MWRSATNAEVAMWHLLRGRRFSRAKFRRQVPFRNYILDFVCFECRVVIEIDGSQWKTAIDFLTALRTAVGAPHWHGWSPDAFIDSTIWGGINELEPPYEIHVIGSGQTPQEVKDYIDLMTSVLEEARKWRLENRGDDIDVSLRVIFSR